jgi:hypothetical protein
LVTAVLPTLVEKDLIDASKANCRHAAKPTPKGGKLNEPAV